MSESHGLALRLLSPVPKPGDSESVSTCVSKVDFGHEGWENRGFKDPGQFHWVAWFGVFCLPVPAGFILFFHSLNKYFLSVWYLSLCLLGRDFRRAGAEEP